MNSKNGASETVEVMSYRGTEIEIPKVSQETVSNENKSAIYNALAERLADTGKITNIHQTDELYFCEDGYIWRDKGDRAVRKYVVNCLPKSVSRHGINHVKEVVKAYQTLDIEQLGPPKNKIPVENGLLDLESMELEEIEPKHFITHKHPVKWDPEAETDEFRKFLEEVIPGKQDRHKLQEFAGYTLLHWGQPFQKLLIEVGPAASGKSTFNNILQSLHDSEVVNNSSLKKLVDTRFEAAMLHGKLVNIRSDLPPHTIRNVGLLKELTGEDYINAEHKRKDPFRFKNKAKMIFSCNRTPTLKNRDRAALRRLEIIEFPNTIPRNKRDPELANRIKENEKKGVFQWAVNGLKRLLEQGEFTNTLDIDKTEDMLLKWGDPILRFIFKLCKRVPDGKISSKELYNRYVDFCQDLNESADSQQSVTKKLKSIGINKAQRRLKTGENPKNAYIGIEWKEKYREQLSQVEQMQRVKKLVKENTLTVTEINRKIGDKISNERIQEIVKHLKQQGNVETIYSEKGEVVKWLE